jgi:hypothetical protein
MFESKRTELIRQKEARSIINVRFNRRTLTTNRTKHHELIPDSWLFLKFVVQSSPLRLRVLCASVFLHADCREASAYLGREPRIARIITNGSLIRGHSCNSWFKPPPSELLPACGSGTSLRFEAATKCLPSGAGSA